MPFRRWSPRVTLRTKRPRMTNSSIASKTRKTYVVGRQFAPHPPPPPSAREGAAKEPMVYSDVPTGEPGSGTSDKAQASGGSVHTPHRLPVNNGNKGLCDPLLHPPAAPEAHLQRTRGIFEACTPGPVAVLLLTVWKLPFILLCIFIYLRHKFPHLRGCRPSRCGFLRERDSFSSFWSVRKVLGLMVGSRRRIDGWC